MRRAAIVVDAVVAPLPSTSTARKSYRPSASVVVSRRHVYGAAVVVHTLVQVGVPLGARSMRTEVTPAVELAVAVRATVPLRYAPGSSIETALTVLSTVRGPTTAEVVVLPARSVATERKE